MPSINKRCTLTHKIYKITTRNYILNDIQLNQLKYCNDIYKVIHILNNERISHSCSIYNE
jgi:hypothetical protein